MICWCPEAGSEGHWPGGLGSSPKAHILETLFFPLKRTTSCGRCTSRSPARMRAPRPATPWRAIYRGGALCAHFPVASQRACAYRWLRTPPRGPSHSSLHRCWPGPRFSPTSQRRASLRPWHRHWAWLWRRYRGRCRGRGVFPVKERRIGI